MLRIHICDNDSRLAELADDWNALAGRDPLRRHEWLATWWRYFGQGKRLLALEVRDAAGQLVGLAPWYLTRSFLAGWTVRRMGDEVACSDHPEILAAPEWRDAVIDTIADFLLAQRRNLAGTSPANGRTDCDSTGAPSQNPRWPGWSDLVFDCVLDEEPTITRLCDRLSIAGCAIDRLPQPNVWRLPLPADWDTYLAQLSKSHRKQLRRFQSRLFDTGRARLYTVTRADQLPTAWTIFVDLHQRRRRSLGEPGLFTDKRFAAWLRAVAERLLPRDMLRLSWLTLDGQSVAAEFQIAGEGVRYAYQAGIEPEALEQEPGRLITLATLRAAQEEGAAVFDFLRGDEPYKPHWRAEPHAAHTLRITAPRVWPRLRRRAWRWGNAAKAKILNPKS